MKRTSENKNDLITFCNTCFESQPIQDKVVNSFIETKSKKRDTEYIAECACKYCGTEYWHYCDVDFKRCYEAFVSLNQGKRDTRILRKKEKTS